jgi:hypothetical protein
VIVMAIKKGSMWGMISIWPGSIIHEDSLFYLQKGNETMGDSMIPTVAMTVPADAAHDQIMSRNVGSSFMTDQIHSLIIGT